MTIIYGVSTLLAMQLKQCRLFARVIPLGNTLLLIYATVSLYTNGRQLAKGKGKPNGLDLNKANNLLGTFKSFTWFEKALFNLGFGKGLKAFITKLEDAFKGGNVYWASIKM